MTYDEYKKIEAVNWSTLKAIGVSPLHYQHALTTERSDTGFFRVGLATHAMVLEPSTVEARYAVYARRRQGKEWDAFKVANAGRHILSKDEWDAAVGAAAAVMINPHAIRLLRRGLKEAVIQWTDDDTGIRLKARFDHAGEVLVDLKSAARIDQRVFASSAFRLGYPSQFAFYEDGLIANDIEPQDDPHMIVVESSAPHDVIVYRMPPEEIERGRDEYKRLLRLLLKCREEKRWPGRAPEVVTYASPAWAIAEGDGPLNLTSGGEAMTFDEGESAEGEA